MLKDAPRFKDFFHGGDPFCGLNAQHDLIDMQGWFSDHPMLISSVELTKPRTIIEIGSWKGLSAISMARVCKQLGLRTEIICVDTWLGSVDHIVPPGSNPWFKELRFMHGYPRLYDVFLNNVICAGVQELITPLPNTSENANAVLISANVIADLIYVDGSHLFPAVYRDICEYWQLLARNGIMVVDDYLAWDGVTRAVDEFVAKNPAILTLKTFGKCALFKDRSYPLKTD